MKIIIVGGGIAGLSAGIFARQSGIDATIIEMHSIPGGNSTSWKRKGYLFEGGMHWLVGSSEKTALHQVWKDLGALQDNNPIYNRDPFFTYLHEGESICLYRDPEKLKAHFMKIAPEDKAAIDQLIKDIKILRKMSMPVMDIKGVRAKYKARLPLSLMPSMMRALPTMNRLNTITTGQYIDQFKNEGIKTVLGTVVGNSGFTASSMIFTLAGLAAGDSGYPEGGSLRMAQNLADTFEKLGGTIHYKTRVQKVEVKDEQAKGVWVNDELHEADAIVVATDALVALDTFFDNPLHESWMDVMRNEKSPLNCTFLSLGVKADLSHLPEHFVFDIAEPLVIEGVSHQILGLNNYANFKGYAPEGCTAVTYVFGEDAYDEWKAAKENGTYKQKKQELAEQVIDRLAQALPETEGKIEVWDIATPLTYERYCGTYRGSWMSIMKPGFKQQKYPCTSESIKGLYFSGQRLMLPGGLPVAAMTARDAIQHVCLDNDLVFQGEYDRK